MSQNPSMALFMEHLESANFTFGVDAKKWGLHGNLDDWPKVIIWTSCSKRFHLADKLHLCFNLTGYPKEGPTAVPWDIIKNAPLPPANWPKGSNKVNAVFKPSWNSGNSLYAPCDRAAQSGHQPWANTHKRWWWTIDKDITTYLNFIYQLLEGDEDE